MQVLRSASLWLSVLAILTAVGDLVYQGIAHASFSLRTVGELAGGTGIERALQSVGLFGVVKDALSPVPFAVLAVVSYALFRIVSLALGHDRSRRL